jgi:hypothetical protein
MTVGIDDKNGWKLLWDVTERTEKLKKPGPGCPESYRSIRSNPVEEYILAFYSRIRG